MTATPVFTGLRPGELHAFRVRDYTGPKITASSSSTSVSSGRFRVPGYLSRLTPPKTVHGQRGSPSSALKVRLDVWLALRLEGSTSAAT